MVPADEVVLRVGIYHQTKKPPKLEQEYLVLGSQSLTVLRDRIGCLKDTVQSNQTHQDSFLYIEGCIYPDTRHHPTKTPGEELRAWAAAHNPDDGSGTCNGWGRFTMRPMEDTTFNDLAIRVGAHYVFSHHGDCEHVLMFSDLRLYNPIADPWKLSSYPLECFVQRLSRILCSACESFAADFVCYGDKLANGNPTYFCMYCYQPFHYNSEGALLYSDFQVFPYTHS